MSGETENDVSAWTPDLIIAHFNRLLSAERDYADGRYSANREYINGKVETLQQRLADMDRATELLFDTVNKVPTDLQKTIADILRLMDERDRRIVGQIEDQDLRIAERFQANALLSQTESGLNQTALAAALAAQEKAAAVTGENFTSIIRGLGERIDRTIDKNAELSSVSTSALAARVTQLAEQVTRAEQRVAEILAGRQAVVEQKTDTRGGTSNLFAGIALAVGVLSLIASVVVTLVR